MQEGILEKVRTKDTKGGKCFILKIDGETMSFFEDSDVELGEIEEGDKVEYTPVDNGSYTNIVELGLLEKKAEKHFEGSSRDTAEMAVLNATKSLAERLSGQDFDLDKFIENRDRLAESTIEAAEELKEGNK